MPIDDFTGDKPDAVANALTTPGKYLKLIVPDFSDTVTNTNPATMAPTPLTSYLRLGAVEDVTKSGKATGTVGLITDMTGNPLVYQTTDPNGNPQFNATFNPAYDPYADFASPSNLPADGSPPLPPATTPTDSIPNAQFPAPPPAGAPAYATASGPDPTGEDLASLIQGFADDTRNRGSLRMTLKGITDAHGNLIPYTPGGNPRDPMTTAEGPLYGYPWVKPTPGAKSPGQLDAANTSLTEDPHYTASSKPVFFPDDYRTLESSQLHTKGGWRDHTDGNRITTTRGDKIEVIRGNYKLIVLGRQDQSKPNKYAAVDMSGGIATTEATGDASTDFYPGSNAYSSLFEWRQCSTPATYAFEAALFAASLGAALPPAVDTDTPQKALDAALIAAQQLADPRLALQSTIAAAQQMVLTADTPAHQLTAATQLGAAKKALLTAQQAVDPDLLQGSAMIATAALATPGVTGAVAKQDSTAAANDPTTGVWYAAGVTDLITTATNLSSTATTSKTWANALAAWTAWTTPLAATVKAALAAWTGTINGQPAPATNAVMCAERVATLSGQPNKTDAVAAAWAQAAAAQAAAQAAAMAKGVFMSPLETLQLWEDTDPNPLPFPLYPDGDYRSFSTTKKGSGPKVQVKYQDGGRNHDYAQKPVDSATFVRGATFAKPISMGVSINETWSSQIYNYTGIGYYPATPPQPWPPAPPAAKSQTLGTSVDPTQMGGVALPATPPTRDPATTEPWPSPLPEWVIYPVAKQVTKNYIVQQSTETFVNQTVAITAGPRSHPKVTSPLQPERTTPSDVMWYVDAQDRTASSYADSSGTVHPLAANAVYDRNLLTDPNTQFSATQFPTPLVDTATAGAWNANGQHNVPPAPPTDPVLAKAQLIAWILGGTPLAVGSYNKIPQTWSETHVSYQATLVRADTTLSDTVVGSQNTMVNANDSTTHTVVTGEQHTILHTGSTTTETTVDGEQSTTLNAGSTFSQTNVSGTTSAITNVAMSSAITNNLMSFTMTNTAMVALALKAALADIQITAALKHFGMNIGICFDITVGPHFTMKLAQMKSKITELDVTAMSKEQLAMFHSIF